MTPTLEAIALPLREDPHGTIRVGGTRVPLETVIYAFQDGNTAEEIVSSFSVLKLADVYAVISYYLNNRAAVDQYIERREVEANEIRRKIEAQPDYQLFRERLLARQGQRANDRQSDGI